MENMLRMPPEKMRVAFEGCGHGTLHAIYASVREACRIKGWDGVDLLIIGGDFQAVRNQYDLNVTAMPQKYRKMADFHEYYSGTRTAPCLTIFIGGNHEASNHLFELYHGGWVAPNIYYLGAANILNLGPLRIAGLSGIWKGYDYRKPHFERLPYNQEEMTSIFHVRELDVRKLLSLRSQVDIGLSHDWPQGVEWRGDHQWLFQSKPYFEADAVSGKLGSVAARQCLDRLRPQHWFSAHLHTKYAAIVEHGDNEVAPAARTTQRVSSRPQQHFDDFSETASTLVSSERNVTNNDTPRHETNGNAPRLGPENRHTPQISAWQNFHAEAQQADAEERAKILQDREKRAEEEEQTGIRGGPQYKFEETFKRVVTDGNLSRTIESTNQHPTSMSETDTMIPNLDGCGFSRPFKRQRKGSGEYEIATAGEEDSAKTPLVQQPQVDGAAILSNPDAIDIDMSDEDDDETEDQAVLGKLLNPQSTSHQSPIELRNSTLAPPMAKRELNIPNSLSEDSDDGGMKLNATATPFKPRTGKSPLAVHEDAITSVKTLQRSISTIKSEMNSNEATQTLQNGRNSQGPNPGASATHRAAATIGDVVMAETPAENHDNEVSEEMRAELAALSNKFTEPDKVQVSPALPFPEDITNKTTHFLALGKCEAFQEFLQLLEIESITTPDKPIERPCKLAYDPTWLAIQRTFASELILGGDPKDPVPTNRGETYYHERIVEEEKWIQKHVTDANLLQIPENFTVTAPIYNPALTIKPNEMPREVTNPQTSAYCKLIGIENPFDISEEERTAHMEQGPRAESSFFQNRPQGGGHRGGGGRGRGGRGGNRGRGRGRGRH